jgi:hypothetical protein
MKALLGFVLAIVLAVGCGSSEKSGGGPVGGGAGGGHGGALGQGGKSVQGGSSGGPGVSGMTAEGGAATEAGGASEAGGLSGVGGASDASGAGGADAAGAPTVSDPCQGKTCGGHGSCSGGTCSCTVGYAAATGCTSCSAGYVGYPNCVTYPVCNTYENFLSGSVCRECKAEDTTVCVSDPAGHDLCFCAKACPSNTCPSLQGVEGECRSGDINRCFLSCAIADGGKNTGCPSGFTCRVFAGGGDAACIQD